jgi:hypothetical protein
LNASKLLTFLASFVILEAIFQYHWPIIIIIIFDYPLHLKCWLMSSIDYLVNLSHQRFGFLFTEAFEQNSINCTIV